MSLVSNDPSWWPLIDSWRFYSYFVVAACVAVVYDSVLTLGQEIELIWRQRWSFMTGLYLSIRYIGLLYAAMFILGGLPTVSVTDTGCNIVNYAINGTNVVVTAMLGVIMTARLHAMYQGSRKMLIFLIVIFLAVNIACVVLTAVGSKYLVGGEFILSGNYLCVHYYEGDVLLLVAMVWTLNAVWEALALFLSIWIAVKHFRDLRRLRSSTGSTIGDCFTVLVKSHALYFASFVAVSCLHLGALSPELAYSNHVGSEMYDGALQIFAVVQMFVLGLRLILSVREFNAKLVADSDAGTRMTSIAFQERVHVSTSASV